MDKKISTFIPFKYEILVQKCHLRTLNILEGSDWSREQDIVLVNNKDKLQQRLTIQEIN